MIDFRHATKAEIAKEIVRMLGIGLLLFVLSLIETDLFTVFRLFGVFPDLTMAFVCAYAWKKADPLAGGICGIAAGVLHDGLLGTLFFVGPVLCFMAGYLIGYLSRNSRRHPPAYFLAALGATMILFLVRAAGSIALSRSIGFLQIFLYEFLLRWVETYAVCCFLYAVYARFNGKKGQTERVEPQPNRNQTNRTSS